MNFFKSPRILMAVIMVVVVAVVGFVYFKQSDQTKPTQVFSKQDIRPDDVVITQTSDGFTPAEVEVKKGTRVVFVNDTSTYVWPASDLHPTHERYPGFDVQEPVPPGQVWGFIFDKVGKWSYHDHLFPRFRGTVNVTE